MRRFPIITLSELDDQKCVTFSVMFDYDQKSWAVLDCREEDDPLVLATGPWIADPESIEDLEQHALFLLRRAIAGIKTLEGG